MILIDVKEHFGSYIKSRFDSMGIESQVLNLPYATGCDYLISNTYGSIGIQRKDAMAELIFQMEDLRDDILPRLCSFTDNPVLLVEEQFSIGESGNLFRKDSTTRMLVETGMHSHSYYCFLEEVRMHGINVVTTRNLDHTIWYLASMDNYLSRQHYPKHQKLYKPYQQAMGMMCCVPGIGEKRAEKVLEHTCIAELACADKVDGLTQKQLAKLQIVLNWR